MQDLRITLIQSNPEWHNVEDNLARLTSILPTENSDVIILPEMFTTGFTMASEEMAEKMEGRSHLWMKEQSARTESVVCGSIIIEENGKYFNRFLWVEPNGKTKFYDKRHLFRMADEHNYYNEGTSEVVITFKGWRIKPLICYDLRFPVWSRNKLIDNRLSYDLLIYVANWPQARISAWDTLLKARAVENSAYTIGLNRVGKDEKGIEYNGHSGIYGPKGEQLYFSENIEFVSTISLNLEDLNTYRAKFPSHLDADSFKIPD
ncbi:MAG: amidohydrolase [Bacteroidota bacterium]